MRSRRSLIVPLLGAQVVALMLAIPAAAATLTVCASGCGYTTIQAAIDAATAGDTITVAAGTYVGDLVIGKQLTILGPNAGIAAGPGPTLSARNPEAIIEGTTAAGAGVSVDGVVVDGFTFIRPSAATAIDDVRLISNASAGIRLTVRNSILDLGVYSAGVFSARGCGSAFSSTQNRANLQSTVTFEYNEVRNQTYKSSAPACTNLSGSRAVYLAGAGTDALVRGNRFVQADMAVYATSSAHRTQVIGNRFQSGGQGPTFGAINDGQIKQNVFVSPQGYAIYLDLSVRSVIEGNVFLDNNVSYPSIAASGTTDVRISGNTFDRATYAETSYWAILLGYPAITKGTVITNNLFTANTAGALWNCTAEGTLFRRNHIASTGKRITVSAGPPAVYEYYAARNGSGPTCTGKALDATDNYWTSAYGFQTIAPATTTRDPDMASYTPSALSPGFWPLPPAVASISEVLSTTADAPPIVAQYAPEGSGAGTLVQLDFGAVGTAGTVNVSSGSAISDGSIGFGANPVISISFSGAFTPPVEVCLSYTDATFGDAEPALWHYSGGAWSQLETSRLDQANRVICGLTYSFSDFGVGVAIASQDVCTIAGRTLTIDIPSGGGVTLSRVNQTLVVEPVSPHTCEASPVTVDLRGRGGVTSLVVNGADGEETVTFAAAVAKVWGRASGRDLFPRIDLGGQPGDLVVLLGTPGNDSILVSTFATYLGGEMVEVYGGEGRDTLSGTSSADALFGQGGDDWLWGWEGDDLLDGGPGTNSLDGGWGTADRCINTGGAHKRPYPRNCEVLI